MSGDLLDKADALMRRRSFVAGSGSANAGPEPSAAPLDDSAVEDLPVLTDIVDDEPAVIEAGTPSQLDIERAVRQRVEQLLMERQVLLAREIERWLDEQMPTSYPRHGWHNRSSGGIARQSRQGRTAATGGRRIETSRNNRAGSR